METEVPWHHAWFCELTNAAHTKRGERKESMAQLTIRLSIIWPNCTPFWTHRSQPRERRVEWIYEKLTFFTRLPLRRIWHFLFHPKPDSISRSHSTTSCARNRKFLFLPSCARQPSIHSGILCCSCVDNKSHWYAVKHDQPAVRGD
jgi:hypothetical protein